MKTLKITTKKGYTAVIINDDISIVKKGNEFYIYDNTSYGTPCEDQSGIDEFVNHYIQVKKNKEAAIELEIQTKIEAERKRVEDLITLSKDCGNGYELSELLDAKYVDVAGHWSDLYEGRSSKGIIFDSVQQYEDFCRIKDELNIEGEFAELKYRAGEHHHTASSVYDLAVYQNNCRNYFGEKYFWKSQETEHDSILEQIKEVNDIDEAKELISNYENIEEGFYDCNGNIVVEGDIDENFLGYSEDVYTYSFGFSFKSSDFNNIEEDEEE